MSVRVLGIVCLSERQKVHKENRAHEDVEDEAADQVPGPTAFGTDQKAFEERNQFYAVKSFADQFSFDQLAGQEPKENRG